MKKIIVYTFLAVSTIACKNSDKKQEAIETNNQDQENTVQTQQEEGDWQYLFNGSSLEGWRGYGEEEMPPGWIIEDNVLTYKTDLGKEEDYTGGRDIIYGAEEFDNFELSLEWKLPEGGNSGIFYHVKEGYENPSKVAPEYQLIDDENYENIHDLTGYNESLGHTENLSELKPLNKTAADYAMYAPDSEKKKLNPVGEWNTSKIVYTPERVEHWLNGEMVVSFNPKSEDWQEKRDSGKWKGSPDYAKFKSGYIGLQDHASPIWFRNIKIKRL
ncbi:DUF1080 domain-containing protein [Salegentibacter agarivorans]|uniref:3-keto-alpha-glucoside-1,2-lyase/3-keto-2-hydroxy-glucal hydratase domain-containing protein n=1 Tax=Salegentibacter agarivorans TaxID=345907 RepID=A0A1I2JWL6_9FLAO|nr:DUF1080 domain-containing protein [Salegentibacter agarivorans]SFF59235.1 protein of unknown function [Salegentibacter agarivorans]